MGEVAALGLDGFLSRASLPGSAGQMQLGNVEGTSSHHVSLRRSAWASVVLSRQSLDNNTEKGDDLVSSRIRRATLIEYKPDSQLYAQLPIADRPNQCTPALIVSSESVLITEITDVDANSYECIGFMLHIKLIY